MMSKCFIIKMLIKNVDAFLSYIIRIFVELDYSYFNSRTSGNQSLIFAGDCEYTHATHIHTHVCMRNRTDHTHTHTQLYIQLHAHIHTHTQKDAFYFLLCLFSYSFCILVTLFVFMFIYAKLASVSGSCSFTPSLQISVWAYTAIRDMKPNAIFSLNAIIGSSAHLYYRGLKSE